MTPSLAAHIVGFAERLYAFIKIRGYLLNTSMSAKEVIQMIFAEMAENPKRFVENVK